MTGLDKKSRNNFRLMNKIAKYTRLDPGVRYKHIQSLTQKLSKKSDNKWGIQIENANPTTEAHIVQPPRIRIGDKKEVTIKQGTFQLRDKIHDRDECLENWAVIYSKNGRNNYDDKMADQLAYQLRQCGKQLGIKVKRPEFIPFNPRNRKLKMGRLIKNFHRNSRKLP